MKRCGGRWRLYGRTWTCHLACGHNGLCWSPRWKIERAFWEWEDETKQEPRFSTRNVVQHDGLRHKRVFRDAIYAALDDVVTTAIGWQGHEVLPLPTLDEQEALIA